MARQAVTSAQQIWRRAPQQAADARLARILLVAAVGITVLGSVAFVAYKLSRYGWYLSPALLAQYWLDYRDGYVRRGLPGEVVSWFTAGAPGTTAVRYAALGLLAAGIAATALLAVEVSRRIPHARERLLVLAVLIASPLTVSLLVHDAGRYDAVGIVALGVVVSLPRSWPHDHPWLGAVAAGGVLGVATASTEFMVVMVAPAIVLWLGWRRRLPLLLALAPALLVAAVSTFHHASPALIRSTVALATRQHGEPVSSQIVGALDNPLAEQVSIVASLHPLNVVGSILVWGGFYLVTVTLVWWLSGRPDPRVVWGAAAYFAAVAVALGVVGVDYRRWWGLALIAFLAALALLVARASAVPSSRPGDEGTVAETLAVVALLAASVLAQHAPVYPRWDDFFSRAPVLVARLDALRAVAPLGW